MTLIDTDILIDAALNVQKAIRCLTEFEQKSGIAISAITQMELIVGCRNKTELRKAEQFLKRFQVIPLNKVISIIALDWLRQYRLSHGLLIPDALIAATAKSLDQPFISKNQQDYRFIKGLQLLPYPPSKT